MADSIKHVGIVGAGQMGSGIAHVSALAGYGVTLYDIAEDGDQLFLVMELLEGQPLSEKLQAGPVLPHDALSLLLPVLEALEALHARDIVHRDLKPSNVFVTGYGVKLLDFGLARPVAGDVAATAPDLTLAGQVVGTPAYMAPEQLDGSPVDVRADLFAAGVLLFEMVAGRSPFAAATTMASMHAVLYERPPALTGSAAVEALAPHPVIALCDRADLRLTPAGLDVFGDIQNSFVQLRHFHSSSAKTFSIPVSHSLKRPFRGRDEVPTLPVEPFALLGLGKVAAAVVNLDATIG